MKRLLVLLVCICCIPSTKTMEPTVKEIRYGVVPTTETAQGDAFFEKRARDFVATFIPRHSSEYLHFSRDLGEVSYFCVFLRTNKNPDNLQTVRDLIITRNYFCDDVSALLKFRFYAWTQENTEYLSKKIGANPPANFMQFSVENLETFTNKLLAILS